MFRRSLVLLVVGMLATAVLPAAADVRIQGRVVDQGGLVLPGTSVSLFSAVPPSSSGRSTKDPQAPADPVQTTVTGGDGTFSFDVAAGDYRVEAQLDGFENASCTVHALAPVTLPDLALRLAHFAAQVTVVATVASEVQPAAVGAPSTIAERVIENAPTRTNRYDDMLPLLPNVVRGPDGLISVAGARAPQGVVLVNGVHSADVASGIPLAPVPLDAVQSVQVIATGFAPEFGPSTGGVTIINTRSGTDTFRFSVNSFAPRFRLADRKVEGIEAWNPNASLRGPIAKRRVWFAQSFDYHFEKTRADTVVGAQDRKVHGFTSFTQVDAKLTNCHVLTVWLNAQQEHVDDEHLGAFNPRGTVPTSEHSAWNAAAIDHATFGTSTLETRLDARHQDASLEPEGTGAYLVGHDITRGAYFDSVTREGLSLQASSVFSHASAGARGKQLFKAGVSLSHRKLDGVWQSDPVTYLRSNLAPAMRIDFVGGGPYEAATTQVGAFVQDTWDVSASVTINGGLRLDHDTRVGTIAGPRGSVAWRAGERTTVSAAAGLYTGDPQLVTLAFDQYPSRQVTTFDEMGRPIGVPITYRNALSNDLAYARARMWSVQVDRRLGAGWQLRGVVQERRGTHEAAVRPSVGDGNGDAVALLATTGESRTRSFEGTVGYHPAGQHHQVYVSYVRSQSKGNTNDFGQVEGLFKEPRLDTAESAPLPADVPHRVLAWGLFSLPYEITVAPFLDVRSGFAFSAVNDDWSYAGPRFASRYPLFASLDLVVNKMVTLHRGMRARVGVKLYNIAGRRNGRDVQADVARSDFGRTYNALGRQVRGVFELNWGS